MVYNLVFDMEIEYICFTLVKEYDLIFGNQGNCFDSCDSRGRASAISFYDGIYPIVLLGLSVGRSDRLYSIKRE